MRLLVAVFLLILSTTWVELAVIHKEPIRSGSSSYIKWVTPPVTPLIKIYIYNVTNADEILQDGATPVVEELGPYVYTEKWDKKNIKFNDNGTVSFNQEKIFMFDESLSNGSEDDVVVVPNVPLLSFTSRVKHARFILRKGLDFTINALGITPFVAVSVVQLLWGYEDPLLKLMKDVYKEQKLPNLFGLMYNQNGTSNDTITLFTGASDITKYGLIDKINGQSRLTYNTSDKCNSLMASDGSIFPPYLTEDSTIHIYNKDLCRILPLVYEKVEGSNDSLAYRFTPPPDVFANVDEKLENLSTPSGFFNVSMCQFGIPTLLSFPHFYLANDSYRTAVEGISPPDPETHRYYIDIEPTTGDTVSVKTRIQYNLVVTHIPDIKQVASLPDIIFPIMWYEDGFDALPIE